MFNRPNLLSKILDYLKLNQVKELLYINKEFHRAFLPNNLISQKVFAKYFDVSTPPEIYKGFLQLKKEAKQLFLKLLNDKHIEIPIIYYMEEISKMKTREYVMKKMEYLGRDSFDQMGILRKLKQSEKISRNTIIRSLDEIILRKLRIEYDCLDFGIITNKIAGKYRKDIRFVEYVFTSLTSFTLDHPFVQVSIQPNLTNVTNLNNTNVNNNQNCEDNQNNENNEIFLTIKDEFSRPSLSFNINSRPFRYIGIVIKIYTLDYKPITFNWDFDIIILGVKINAEVLKMEGGGRAMILSQ